MVRLTRLKENPVARRGQALGSVFGELSSIQDGFLGVLLRANVATLSWRLALLGLPWLSPHSHASHPFDVVDHCEELPLCAHLALTAERKAPHPFVLDVGKDWFGTAHAAAVEFSTERRVELLPHALRCSTACLASLERWSFSMFDECHLTLTCSVWVSGSQMTKSLLRHCQTSSPGCSPG